MSELVVVSNRGPVSIERGEGGELVARHGAGGLAPSLHRALNGTEALWVASAMTGAEQQIARDGVPEGLSVGTALRLVDVPAAVRDGAYRVIANATLWFVLHGLFDRARRPVFDRHWHEAWARYGEYNEAFADEIAVNAGEGATVVVNDYHLFLVGTYLKARRPDLSTVHFTHTPFARPEELEILPSAVRNAILEAMGAFGACGFHTEAWADAYRACAKVFLGTTPTAFACPLGADATDLHEAATSPECRAAGAALEERLAGRRLLVRSDRAELSKNLLRGFLAFEELLDARPEWRHEVLFVARAYPSRQDLPAYRAYRVEAEHLVERINSRFGDVADGPIALEVEDDFPASLAALRRYDALLVNPVRDGMNLVAKEGPILNERDGVLLLSRQAGAFAELGEHVEEVEPFDVTGTAKAIERALELDAPRRRARSVALKRLAATHAPGEWFDEVVAHAITPTS